MNDEKAIERTAPEAEDTGGEIVRTSRSMQEIVMSSVRSGPDYHPVFDKFESQHVTQFLTQMGERDKRLAERDTARHKTTRGNRWFRFAYVMCGIGVFGFLTWMLLPGRSDLYFQILQAIGLFGSGLAGGYGIKAYQDQRSGDE